MKTIGILGGLGPESTISYYKLIADACFEKFGNYTYPEIVIYSMDFQPVIDKGYQTPTEIKTVINKLHKAGADFVVAACNSIHLVYDEVVESGLPIPWLSIIDATAEEIVSRGMKKIGLLGTKFTMGQGFFQKGLERHGVEALTPEAEVQKKINAIIYDELVRGIVTEVSRNYYLEEINRLRDRGAEGVILGCTEIPLLISQEHTSIPVFDTTALHAKKALAVAMDC